MAANNILVGAGFIGVGLLLIVLGIRKNKRCSGVVVGKITGVHEDVDIDDEGYNSYSYSPEFEYEVNGKVYHGSGSRAYSKRKKFKSAAKSKCITILKNRMRVSPKAEGLFCRFWALCR